MARPLKRGLDYFPLDVDFWSDDKILVFMEKYQLVGVGFLTILWGQVYKGGAAPFLLNDNTWLYLKRILRISRKKFDEMLAFSINLGLFSEQPFNDHRIITSPRIERTVAEILAERARKRSLPPDETGGETPGEMGGETPQRKEKQSNNSRAKHGYAASPSRRSNGHAKPLDSEEMRKINAENAERLAAREAFRSPKEKGEDTVKEEGEAL
jgi:hypothetical protein